MKIITALFVLGSALLISCGLSKQPTGLSPASPKLLEPNGVQFVVDQDKEQTNLPEPIDFSINDVRLGTDEPDILRKLGRPQRFSVEKINACGDDEKGRVMVYHGLKIQLDHDPRDRTYGAIQIEVTEPGIVISPGFRIGESIDEIKEKLGNAPSEKDGEEITLNYLTKSNDLAGLVFRENRLIRVTLWVNPC